MERVKILFFIEELRAGGAEKVLCNLVNEMDQNRFDVTVQTLWKADAEKYLKPGVRYRYCYGENNRINSLLCRAETAAGLTYRFHIKGDYDIEVAYLECGATKIMATSTNKKSKKIAWVHCDLALKVSDPQAFVEKAAKWYAKYDRVVCVSQTALESFRSLFGMDQKTLVLYNTVDDAAIREKALLQIPRCASKRRTTVVSVGRLSKEKCFDRLLRVHRQLLDGGAAHDLWILGDGPEREMLSQMIADLHVEDSAKLVGYCENPYPYMADADLLVCSSRYEGLSTFVTEGLILGKPVVTTRCSGMDELLGDSEYGLITENSEEALLEGMRTMLRDACLRERYAARSAERGRDFSARQLTEKTERFFLNILED